MTSIAGGDRLVTEPVVLLRRRLGARRTVAAGSCSPSTRARVLRVLRTGRRTGARRTDAARRAAAASRSPRRAPPSRGRARRRTPCPRGPSGDRVGRAAPSRPAAPQRRPSRRTAGDHPRVGRGCGRLDRGVRPSVRHDDGRRPGGACRLRRVAVVRRIPLRDVGVGPTRRPRPVPPACRRRSSATTASSAASPSASVSSTGRARPARRSPRARTARASSAARRPRRVPSRTGPD